MKTDTKWRVGLSASAVFLIAWVIALAWVCCCYTRASGAEVMGTDVTSIYPPAPPPVVEMADSGRPGDPDIYVNNVLINPMPPEPKLVVVDNPLFGEPDVYLDVDGTRILLDEDEYYMPPRIEIHENPAMPPEYANDVWWDGDVMDPNDALFVLLVIYIMSAFDDPDFEWEEDDGQ